MKLNPDVEKKRIIKEALKYEMDTSNILTDGVLYDKNGGYIEYRKKDTSCNGVLFQFIPSLNLTDQYHQPDSSNLNTELNRFRDLKGNSIAPLEEADFYLLIFWAVWTGKLNEDHVKIWEDLARENKSCKIQVIKVNLDFQE